MSESQNKSWMDDPKWQFMIGDSEKIAEMEDQPKVTDFTEIVASVIKDGEYAVRVILDSGIHVVATLWVCRKEAERLELAINQGMIEYRTKMNAWEKKIEFDIKTKKDKDIVESVRRKYGNLGSSADERECPDSPDGEHHADERNCGFLDVHCKHCGQEATVEIYW